MKEDNRTQGREAFNIMPLILFTFLLLATLAKVSATHDSMQQDDPYDRGPRIENTARP
jgi:hypothetical protein